VELSSAAVDELFALARSAEEDEAYWEAVSELHARPEDRTFQLASVLCDSFAGGERCLGADVLAQLGATPGASPADSPYASAAAEVLMRLLEEDDEPAVLSSAAVGLGHLRDDRAIAPLVGLASNPDPNVRRAVVHGLMGHDDDGAVEALIALSADEDGDVRDWATFSLGVQIDRDTEDVREALAARLDDTHGDTRAEAVRGLARRRDERALEAVLSADDSSSTLDEAVVLLGATTGDPRLCDRLEALRADPETAALYGEELERALERCGAAG
jgi:HEAT repeat protein